MCCYAYMPACQFANLQTCKLATLSKGFSLYTNRDFLHDYSVSHTYNVSGRRFIRSMLRSVSILCQEYIKEKGGLLRDHPRKEMGLSS